MDKSVTFAIGTGRCGTTFIHRLFSLEPHIKSHHERNPLNDTFHRYCKWYGIDVDHAGFLNNKRIGIDEDFKNQGIKHSFESSAYLSLSVSELYEAFNAKFILLVRNPYEVVRSYQRKGWYKESVYWENVTKPPTTQPTPEFHHFLGRPMPMGNEFPKWTNLSQVGKLSWYWNSLNAEVLKQFESLPASHKYIQKLEEFNYEAYRNISDWIGINTSLEKADFDRIAIKKPNTNKQKKEIEWSESEWQEFQEHVGEVASHFNYPSAKTTCLEYNRASDTNPVYNEVKKTVHEPSSSELIKDVTVIIRTVGERTEQACYDIIAQQVHQEQIFKVSEVPFSKTLKKSLELGIKEGRKWTLCIDADVLLKDEAVKDLLKVAEDQDEAVIEIQAGVLDKFFLSPRPAGNHLYRTKYLDKALVVLENTNSDIRPEHTMLLELKKYGYEWINIEMVVGVHDYEQDNVDIFRKCMIQAHKHDYHVQKLYERWRDLKNTDQDFQIALAGLADGMMAEKLECSIDENIRASYEQNKNKFGWSEKEKHFRIPDIDHMESMYLQEIQAGKISPVMMNQFRKYFGNKDGNHDLGDISKSRNKILYHIHKVLKGASNRFFELSERK